MSSFFRLTYAVGTILFAAFFCCSCAGPSDSVKLSGTPDTYTRIAVMPFQEQNPEDTIDQLLPRFIAGPRDLTESPEKVVESIFLEKLAENKKIVIIPVSDTQGAYSQLTTDNYAKRDAELVRKLGKTLKADAIVVGYVYRYNERKGTTYAVEKPASVAFELQILDTSDGMRSWKATFDMTQRSLMENLLHFRFFVKEKGKWVTARELAEAGMEQVMQGFPGPR